MPDLTPQDWEAVRAYAYHDMGLTAAARELHMHVNTLRYHLGKVHEVTGIDPRTFYGLMELLYPRCKDCKHLTFSDCYAECSIGRMGIVRPDDFCCYGERKGET